MLHARLWWLALLFGVGMTAVAAAETVSRPAASYEARRNPVMRGVPAEKSVFKRVADIALVKLLSWLIVSLHNMHHVLYLPSRTWGVPNPHPHRQLH